MSRSYLEVADEIAAEVAAYRLPPGARLPPQRMFAYQSGIAASTASRVYLELARRGLVVGEVGRGTFVRGVSAPADPPLIEPTALPVDLEMVFSAPPGTVELLAAGLRRVLEPAVLADAFRPMGAWGTPPLREASSMFLSRQGWKPEPDRFLFAANGRGGIAAALSALAKPGDRVGVEALTYPVVKGLASRLGLQLVPIALDAEGAIPEAALAAHQATPLAGFYLQPTLHSPLGISMSENRRRSWAALIKDTGLTVVEDAIYSFLAPNDLPLAALAPEQVIHVDSLSKRAAPGLSLGILSSPDRLRAPLATALRSGAWSAAAFAVVAATAWMTGGEAAAVVEAKRHDAHVRQQIAREVMKDFSLQADSRSYHAWLQLPEPWRAEAFVVAALRHGIAITAGSAFAVTPGHAPSGVRLALAAPSLPALRGGLEALRNILEAGPSSEID